MADVILDPTSSSPKDEERANLACYVALCNLDERDEHGLIFAERYKYKKYSRHRLFFYFLRREQEGVPSLHWPIEIVCQYYKSWMHQNGWCLIPDDSEMEAEMAQADVILDPTSSSSEEQERANLACYVALCNLDERNEHGLTFAQRYKYDHYSHHHLFFYFLCRPRDETNCGWYSNGLVDTYYIPWMLTHGWGRYVREPVKWWITQDDSKMAQAAATQSQSK